MLEILRPSCPVIFESCLSYPESLGGHDYRDGVKWVKGILASCLPIDNDADLKTPVRWQEDGNNQ